LFFNCFVVFSILFLLIPKGFINFLSRKYCIKTPDKLKPIYLSKLIGFEAFQRDKFVSLDDVIVVR